jgi:hypothetical protein
VIIMGKCGRSSRGFAIMMTLITCKFYLILLALHIWLMYEFWFSGVLLHAGRPNASEPPSIDVTPLKCHYKTWIENTKKQRKYVCSDK